MKNHILASYILLSGLMFLSCEDTNITPEPEPGPGSDSIAEIKPDPEYFFKIGRSLYYRYSDIELYDSSVKIIYFKTNHPEFDRNSQSEFSVIAGSDTIYKGDFWPMFRSDTPKRVYIHTWPFWLQNYALWIENRYNISPDLRNAEPVIQALKDHKLLHSGLLVEIVSLEISSERAAFSFSLTNKDSDALLILDPDKMGINLFHYFTNGVTLRKSAGSQSISLKVPYQAPDPWNSWKPDWLTRLGPGDTKTFRLVYPIASPIAPGEYNVSFAYPGLHSQVSKEQLIQNNARIWLGEIRKSFRISIQ